MDTKLMLKNGLTEALFAPANKDLTAEERIAILEDAFAELCEEVFADD